MELEKQIRTRILLVLKTVFDNSIFDYYCLAKNKSRFAISPCVSEITVLCRARRASRCVILSANEPIVVDAKCVTV